MTGSTWKNKLFFGDNLKMLREEIADESVDLVYLDPPFNSNASYNILFAEKSGEKSGAQIQAFDDTWHWGFEAELAYGDAVHEGGQLAKLLPALRAFLGQNDMMAYIVMMAPRLVELHRVLKPTGTIYLHCDPTASHYLKLLMDAIFGASNFQNEISWKRTTTKNDYRQGAVNWPRIRDVILYFSKDRAAFPRFNQPFSSYSKEYIASHYSQKDESGRFYQLDNLTAPGAGSRGHPTFEFMGVTRFWRYNKAKMEALLSEGRIVQPHSRAVPRYKRFLDEMPGIAIGDTWDDVPAINSQAQERLGYPTQKPESLLERIIKASSNEGDVILDPFCGCGTAVHVAESLNRRWIGMDITHLAISLIRHRLQFAFDKRLSPYEVKGDPKDLQGAIALANLDRYDFEWWAMGLVGARHARDRKKGADGGIDGRLPFIIDHQGTVIEAVVQVKSGHVSRNQIGDLNNCRIREKAELALFLTLEEPTEPMRREAASAGFYSAPWEGTSVPRIQILTIDELLRGHEPKLPRRAVTQTYKRPPRAEKGKPPEQGRLFGKQG